MKQRYSDLLAIGIIAICGIIFAINDNITAIATSLVGLRLTNKYFKQYKLLSDADDNTDT